MDGWQVNKGGYISLLSGGASSSQNAFVQTHRTHLSYGPKHDLPLQCLVNVGDKYTFHAKMKLLDEHNSEITNIYKEVRPSENATAIDRGKACYELGRISLRIALDTGELHQRWRGCSICLDLSKGNHIPTFIFGRKEIQLTAGN